MLGLTVSTRERFLKIFPLQEDRKALVRCHSHIPEVKGLGLCFTRNQWYPSPVMNQLQQTKKYILRRSLIGSEKQPFPGRCVS